MWKNFWNKIKKKNCYFLNFKQLKKILRPIYCCINHFIQIFVIIYEQNLNIKKKKQMLCYRCLNQIFSTLYGLYIHLYMYVYKIVHKNSKQTLQNNYIVVVIVSVFSSVTIFITNVSMYMFLFIAAIIRKCSQFAKGSYSKQDSCNWKNGSCILCTEV